MKIDYPDNYSLSDLNEKFFWKYLDLYKLFDLLNSQQLYFARLDQYEDGLEGITGKGIGLKAISQGQALTMENISTAFDKETQDRLIAGDQRNRKEYSDSIEASQKSQYACCWFVGDRESLAMWKLYSKKEGVAIKFKARQLTDTIIASAKSLTNTDFSILYYGPVEYKNIWPFDPHETFNGKFNGLKKDKSYIHENEFRFVAVVSSDKIGVHHHLKLPIGQVSNYDIEIITNPFMEQWQFDILKLVLHDFQIDDKLQKSKMEVRK
ncbi:MAG: DUF2971 domain-containing protein [Bacteroidia bacterium]|nr:DUF2971 domain-containing protein [Bacteroidia bacterium]MBP7261434.1 DUF2971 domain-containing protein [Bacteroidia bacterium]MBP9724768.1 DUF2971 domain-containing protein [Bacteroidia bacterium]